MFHLETAVIGGACSILFLNTYLLSLFFVLSQEGVRAANHVARVSQSYAVCSLLLLDCNLEFTRSP